MILKDKQLVKGSLVQEGREKWSPQHSLQPQHCRLGSNEQYKIWIRNQARRWKGLN